PFDNLLPLQVPRPDPDVIERGTFGSLPPPPAQLPQARDKGKRCTRENDSEAIEDENQIKRTKRKVVKAPAKPLRGAFRSSQSRSNSDEPTEPKRVIWEEGKTKDSSDPREDVFNRVRELYGDRVSDWSDIGLKEVIDVMFRIGVDVTESSAADKVFEKIAENFSRWPKQDSPWIVGPQGSMITHAHPLQGLPESSQQHLSDIPHNTFNWTSDDGGEPGGTAESRLLNIGGASSSSSRPTLDALQTSGQDQVSIQASIAQQSYSENDLQFGHLIARPDFPMGAAPPSSSQDFARSTLDPHGFRIHHSRSSDSHLFENLLSNGPHQVIHHGPIDPTLQIDERSSTSHYQLFAEIPDLVQASHQNLVIRHELSEHGAGSSDDNVDPEHFRPPTASIASSWSVDYPPMDFQSRALHQHPEALIEYIRQSGMPIDHQNWESGVSGQSMGSDCFTDPTDPSLLRLSQPCPPTIHLLEGLPSNGVEHESYQGQSTGQAYPRNGDSSAATHYHPPSDISSQLPASHQPLGTWGGSSSYDEFLSDTVDLRRPRISRAAPSKSRRPAKAPQTNGNNQVARQPSRARGRLPASGGGPIRSISDQTQATGVAGPLRTSNLSGGTVDPRYPTFCQISHSLLQPVEEVQPDDTLQQVYNMPISWNGNPPDGEHSSATRHHVWSEVPESAQTFHQAFGAPNGRSEDDGVPSGHINPCHLGIAARVPLSSLQALQDSQSNGQNQATNQVFSIWTEQSGISVQHQDATVVPSSTPDFSGEIIDPRNLSIGQSGLSGAHPLGGAEVHESDQRTAQTPTTGNSDGERGDQSSTNQHSADLPDFDRTPQQAAPEQSGSFGSGNAPNGTIDPRQLSLQRPSSQPFQGPLTSNHAVCQVFSLYSSDPQNGAQAGGTTHRSALTPAVLSLVRSLEISDPPTAPLTPARPLGAGEDTMDLELTEFFSEYFHDLSGPPTQDPASNGGRG
ncbi:hypothetical protein FRB90_009472, partial [Tulasnella sp. 427]